MPDAKEVFNLKRIKYLFRMFLKQFEVDEYKLLMQYLQLSINKYNQYPGYFDQERQEDGSLEACFKKNNTNPNKKKPINSQATKSKLATIEDTINMLKTRNDIIESFIVKDDDTDVDGLGFEEDFFVEEKKNITDLCLEDDELDLIENNVEAIGDKGLISINDEIDENLYDERIEDNFEYPCNEEFQTNTLTYNNTPIKIYNQNSYELGTGSQYLNKYLPHSSSQMYEETENDDCEDEFAYLGETGESALLDDYFDEDNAAETSSAANSDIHCQRRSLQAPSSSKKQTFAVNKSFPGQLTGEKKFIRKFNDSTRAQLELKFAQNNFISRVEKDELATQLNLTERQVKKWFEKRREKKRRLERQAFDVSGASAAYHTTSMKSHKKKKDTSNQADASVASTNRKGFSNDLKIEPTEANYYDQSDEPTFGQLKSTKMTTQVN